MQVREYKGEMEGQERYLICKVLNLQMHNCWIMWSTQVQKVVLANRPLLSRHGCPKRIPTLSSTGENPWNQGALLAVILQRDCSGLHAEILSSDQLCSNVSTCSSPCWASCPPGGSHWQHCTLDSARQPASLCSTRLCWHVCLCLWKVQR